MKYTRTTTTLVDDERRNPDADRRKFQAYGPGRVTLYTLHKRWQSDDHGAWWQRRRWHQPGMLMRTRQLARQAMRRMAKEELAKLKRSDPSVRMAPPRELNVARRFVARAALPTVQHQARYRWSWRHIIAARAYAAGENFMRYGRTILC